MFSYILIQRDKDYHYILIPTIWYQTYDYHKAMVSLYISKQHWDYSTISHQYSSRSVSYHWTTQFLFLGSLTLASISKYYLSDVSQEYFHIGIGIC